MKVLKTLKRFAAIGTGAVMLGATLTGALAQDLAKYPEPFVVNGVYDDSNVFVYGDSALADDAAAMADIAASLQFMAKTPVSTSGSTVVVTGGTSKQIPLGLGLTNGTLFDKTLQDDDIETLFDGEISFQGTKYDTSEELQLCDQSNPWIVTSLAGGQDDYGTDVFLHVTKDKIKYAYQFDESINVSLASSTQPLKIDFLGKTLKIISVDSATSFTAYVGEEHFMDVGDSVDVDGHTVELKKVGSSSVVVAVDGQEEVLSDGSSLQFDAGLEVTVDTIFYSSGDVESSSANLVIGADSSQTYNDGDAYVGEDKDDPDWVWDIAGLTRKGTSIYTDCGDSGSATNVLRIENDFVWNDDSDNPAGVGDCLSLPNDYLQICLDSLTVGDDALKEYTFEFDTTADLSDAG